MLDLVCTLRVYDDQPRETYRSMWLWQILERTTNPTRPTMWSDSVGAEEMKQQHRAGVRAATKVLR